MKPRLYLFMSKYLLFSSIIITNLLCIVKSHAQIIHTVDGDGAAGYTGDNIPATATKLNYPASVAVDRAGNLYIADWDNDRIRMVNTTGIIRTIAGTGSLFGYSGDG